MVDLEPEEEVTDLSISAGEVLNRLRKLVDETRKTKPSPQNLEGLKEQIRNLLDPGQVGTESEDDPLLALAERYFEVEDYDPAQLLGEVRRAMGIRDSSLLPEPVVGEAWDKMDPDREWLVNDWLPAGELVLLSGPGNVGKSLLVLQLACALATSREVASWIPKGPAISSEAPARTSGGIPVVMANWEDSAPEARRRRYKLHTFGGCKWANCPDVSGNLHVLPMRGKGPAWGPGGSRHISVLGELTDTGKVLRRYCEEIKARLLVLDPVSLALAVEENSRPLVSVALESWAGWATETGCAVLLTGHPSKVEEGEGSDYSGSTAWRGLVRSLWTLKSPKGNNQNAPETRAELTLNKANYAKAGQILYLQTCGKGSAWHLHDEPTSSNGKKEIGEKKKRKKEVKPK